MYPFKLIIQILHRARTLRCPRRGFLAFVFLRALCTFRLVAKLARAEDAAKKLLSKGDKIVKGNTGARLFELEGELSRVQDENTQMRHKLARRVSRASSLAPLPSSSRVMSV